MASSARHPLAASRAYPSNRQPVCQCRATKQQATGLPMQGHQTTGNRSANAGPKTDQGVSVESHKQKSLRSWPLRGLQQTNNRLPWTRPGQCSRKPPKWRAAPRLRVALILQSGNPKRLFCPAQSGNRFWIMLAFPLAKPREKLLRCDCALINE